jgi:hypothetical protein
VLFTTTLPQPRVAYRLCLSFRARQMPHKNGLSSLPVLRCTSVTLSESDLPAEQARQRTGRLDLCKSCRLQELRRSSSLDGSSLSTIYLHESPGTTAPNSTLGSWVDRRRGPKEGEYQRLEDTTPSSAFQTQRTPELRFSVSLRAWEAAAPLVVEHLALSTAIG